jgi:K+-sensing histidine kinase KdpD
MNFYSRKNLWKFILMVFAILIGAITLLYTEGFLRELRQEEIKKVDQWANAMSAILRADEKTDLTLATQIIQYNTTIPVILTNERDSIIASKNLDSARVGNKDWLYRQLTKMKEEGSFITVNFANDRTNFVYYRNSTLLTQLRLYPIILLVVISLFVIIAYNAFSGARKAEQNQVWNGLAKETAHQIGTPLSSLMGWLEILKMQEASEEITREMHKDIKRLETITNRFSKIGSQPHLEKVDLLLTTRQAVDYLRNRSPKKVEVICDLPQEPVYAMINIPLYEWVIENLIRNAIDAIDGPGRIDIMLSSTDKQVQVDIKDTGKGIPPSRVKTIFRPGYSTKKRGWGLGLSLAKRIIEQYHGGRIFVAQSEPDKGTTFRVLLAKVAA